VTENRKKYQDFEFLHIRTLFRWFKDYFANRFQPYSERLSDQNDPASADIKRAVREFVNSAMPGALPKLGQTE